MSPRSEHHPDHSAEQAYLDRIHQAYEKSRDRALRLPDVVGDKHAAREARKQMLERFQEAPDLESLCFGRLDTEPGKTYYLGRGAVHDASSRLMVINWRVPAAAPFYTATREDPQGVRLRRRFQLDQQRLLGMVDDDFVRAAIASTGDVDAILEDADGSTIEAPLADAILADMQRARGGAMRDIVATIEGEQYKLISDPIEGLLIVQGGPGSGKTAIALHRAAWLMYNHEEELARSGVLVVGPNRAFMEYVARVLPSLGETAVVQQAVDRLPNIKDVRVRGVESPSVARLKGDVRMAGIIDRAVRARVRPPKEDVHVSVEHRRVHLPSAAIETLIDEAWRAASTYLAAREVFRRRTVEAVRREFQDRTAGSLPSSSIGPGIEAAVAGEGGVLERVWPTVTAGEVVRDLFNSRRRLEQAAQDILSEEELDRLLRNRMQLLRDEPWTSADLPLLDEAEAVLRGLPATYGYVLADEAQDLSPMQLRMVLRRTTAGRATLVGDIAQATSPERFPDWLDLVAAAGVEAQPRIAELGIGYRVPEQIMLLAAELLPRIAPNILLPIAVRAGAEDPRVLPLEDEQMLPSLVAEVAGRIGGGRSVGVICPDSRFEIVRSALVQANFEVGEVLADGLGREVTVLTAEQSKGLEFDHVVVADPAGIAGADNDWARVYIALTRATQTLSVLYSTEEPFPLVTDVHTPEPDPEELVPASIDVPVVARREPVLGARYTEALMLAKFLHRGQTRRGTAVPFFAHLQSVAALVLEDGGSEDEAIAALLHDAVEDCGSEVLDQVMEQFGTNVARIVAGCSDPGCDQEVSWQECKELHLLELEAAGPEVRRVALAEKLDNARALLRDYRRLGERLWARMELDADETQWYVAALADLFVTERPGDMASELEDTVDRLLDLISRSESETSAAPEPVGR